MAHRQGWGRKKIRRSRSNTGTNPFIVAAACGVGIGHFLCLTVPLIWGANLILQILILDILQRPFAVVASAVVVYASACVLQSAGPLVRVFTKELRESLRTSWQTVNQIVCTLELVTTVVVYFLIPGQLLGLWPGLSKWRHLIPAMIHLTVRFALAFYGFLSSARELLQGYSLEDSPVLHTMLLIGVHTACFQAPQLLRRLVGVGRSLIQDVLNVCAWCLCVSVRLARLLGCSHPLSAQCPAAAPEYSQSWSELVWLQSVFISWTKGCAFTCLRALLLTTGVVLGRLCNVCWYYYWSQLILRLVRNLTITCLELIAGTVDTASQIGSRKSEHVQLIHLENCCVRQLVGLVIVLLILMQQGVRKILGRIANQCEWVSEKIQLQFWFRTLSQRKQSIVRKSRPLPRDQKSELQSVCQRGGARGLLNLSESSVELQGVFFKTRGGTNSIVFRYLDLEIVSMPPSWTNCV